MLKKFHFGVYGLLEKDEKYLLVQKSRGPYEGLLDLPGGRPVHGESPVETLQREIKEETGIHVVRSRLKKEVSYVFEYTDLESGLVSLHHIALLYEVLAAKEESYQPFVVREDVAGSVWKKITDTEKMRYSPLVIKAIFP